MFITYRDSKIWQNSHKNTLEIVALVRELPQERVAGIFGTQVVRSSASTSANIAEGFGRYGNQEYKRYLEIALGSANETDYWLRLISDVYPRYSSKIEKMLKIHEETIKMLSAAIKTLKKRRSARI